MTTVIKRDGRKFNFDKTRIQVAVKSAKDAVRKGDESSLEYDIADDVEKWLDGVESVEISSIVAKVENDLMDLAPDVARAYIEYRQSRDLHRSKKSDMVTAIRGILDQTDDAAKLENANKDSAIIPTMRDMVAGAAAKEVAKHILPPHIIEAHISGDLHYHDLDYAPAFPMVNCCLVNLRGMLEEGFRMGNAEIETPRSIATACAVTAQIIAQVASHIYGGTTIDNIDEVLAPYVKISYDKHLEVAHEWGISKPEAFAMARTEKECDSAFQGLEYEVNTLHTANGQTPFVTFVFGSGRGWCARMIQKAILNNRIKGIGKHGKTPTFPKLVFYKENGVNNQYGDENYDIKQLAIKCSAKRLYPDYLSVESLIRATGSKKGPMGCRSFLGPYTNPETGELEHDGRCNLGVVSVNLPRIAIEANGDIGMFYDILRQRTDLCYEALMTRIDRLRGVKARVAPILYMEGAFGKRLKADDEIMQLFENGRSSISLGYIGIHETVLALTGKHAFHDADAGRLGIEIVQYLRDCVERWKHETGFGFSLYSTPSENLCDRFLRLDREKFGVIPEITDHDYYTNSFHLDVAEQTNPYDKYDFESPYPYIANGGFINYAEYPDMKNNLDGLERVIDYTHDQNPYIGINVPSDDCYVCGFSGETKVTAKGFECPKCGNRDLSKMSVIRRICGYLGAERGVIFGKLQEMRRRVKHL